jgi:hypothetical protein
MRKSSLFIEHSYVTIHRCLEQLATALLSKAKLRHINSTNILREAFKFFAEWLHKQKIRVVQLREEYVNAPENRAEQGNEEFALHDLWVLADKFSIPALQNLAMKVIDDISNKWNRVSTGYMLYVWTNTQANSPLRRYYVKQRVHNLGEEFFKEEPSSFMLEIVVDLTYLMSLRT